MNNEQEKIERIAQKMFEARYGAEGGHWSDVNKIARHTHWYVMAEAAYRESIP